MQERMKSEPFSKQNAMATVLRTQQPPNSMQSPWPSLRRCWNEPLLLATTFSCCRGVRGASIAVVRSSDGRPGPQPKWLTSTFARFAGPFQRDLLSELIRIAFSTGPLNGTLRT